MKSFNTNCIFLSVFFLCLSMGCESVTDYYIGIPQQPEFKENNFEEGMNVFGLLRPDNKNGFNSSFVFVQQNWPVLENKSYFIIQGVQVLIRKIEGGVPGGSIIFPLIPSDTLFRDTLYRPEEEFVPEVGEKYQLFCTHPDFPDLTGETTIPSPPQISPNSWSLEGNTLKFSVNPDSIIKMIDIYQIDGSKGIYIARYVTNDSIETDVEINLPVAYEGTYLKIFSYDANLASYYGNFNISLNFNKYRTTFSTLESGFGVFGSLNYTLVDLPE